MNIIINQTFGTIATILSIVSLLSTKKKKLLKMQLISNILFTFQYIVLNAKSAAFVSVIAILRSLFFSNNKHNKIKLTILISLALCTGILSYNGTFLSLIPIINSILCIFGASLKDIKKYKLIYGTCSLIWIYYNIQVGAYVIIISNIFEIISAIIGYKRHK